MAQGDLTTGIWVQDPNQPEGQRDRDPKYIWKEDADATMQVQPWQVSWQDYLKTDDSARSLEEKKREWKRQNEHLDKYSPESSNYDPAYVAEFDNRERNSFGDTIKNAFSSFDSSLSDVADNTIEGVGDIGEAAVDLAQSDEAKLAALIATGAQFLPGAPGAAVVPQTGGGGLNAMNAGTLATGVVNPTGSGFTGDVTGGMGTTAVPTGINIDGNAMNAAANAGGYLNPDGTWNNVGQFDPSSADPNLIAGDTSTLTPPVTPVTPPPVTPAVTPSVTPVTPPPVVPTNAITDSGVPDWLDPALIAGGGLVSGYLANDAANNATDLNRDMFNTINANNAPYMGLGQTGIDAVTNPLTGIGTFNTTNQPEWKQYSNYVAPEGGLTDRAVNAFGDTNQPSFQAPDDFKFEAKTDPGYKFIFDEAMRATNRGAAANKAYNSGNTLTALQDRAYSLADTNLDDQYRRQLGAWNANLGKDLSSYGLNYGANMDDFNMRFGLYGDDYNKYQDNIANNMNLVNTGLNATGGANQAATNYGTNAANIGTGAAWNTSNIINDSIKNWLQYNSGK